MKGKLLVFLLSITLLFSLFSCEKKQEDTLPEEVFYEITFSTSTLDYTATPPETLRVKEGDSVAEPKLDVPPTAGYVVIWTKDASEQEPYDFSAPVEESFLLYAVEIPRNYSITYLLNGGVNAKENPTIYSKASERIELMPLDPKKNQCPWGYSFVKWSYFDDPDSTVTAIEHGMEGDIVLRAVYTPAVYKIVYMGILDGVEKPEDTRFVYGEDKALPSLAAEGYRFLGYTINKHPELWVENQYLTSAFIRNNWKAISKENGFINLVAMWEPLSEAEEEG